jgi:hypothetical protein
MRKKSVGKKVNPLIVEEKLLTTNTTATADKKKFELPATSKKSGPMKVSVLKNRH